MSSEEAPTAREITDLLLDQIASGKLKPGEKLGSTAHLAQEHRVGEKTIYRAIALLKESGQVEGHQGKGVFVRAIAPLEWHLHRFEQADRRDDQASGLDAWKVAAIEQGRTPTQDTPQVSVEPAPPEVAAWLQLEPEAYVVARRRVRRVDGEPFQLADSWFPARIALDTDLMLEEDVTRAGGVLSHIGHPQKRVRDEIRSWPPTTPDEASRLEVPKGVGTPAIRHARIGYDADDQPVRVMVTVAPGHLNTLVYELEV